MAAARGLDLTGIHNVGEFYSHHYLTALLEGDLKGTLKRWAAAEKDGGAKTPAKRLAALANKFFGWQGQAAGHAEVEPRLEPAREFHAHVLEALGYTRNPGVEDIGEGEVVPVVATEEVNRRPFLWVVEAPFASEDDDADPLGEAPHVAQVPESAGTVTLPTASWRELLDGRLLRRDEAPRWVLVLAGSDIFLVDRDKWAQGKCLHFEVAELMGRRQSTAMRALAGLLHREVLLPEGGQSLLDTLDENSHKHAFAVSTDLKYGARKAIELIANEAIRYVRQVRKDKLFGDEELARKLTRESLMYLYRLLFLFYVEARGTEMEDAKGNAVVPMKSDAYRLGYSLETLRDLELVPLTSVAAREGFYLDTSLRRLFTLIFEGHGYGQRDLDFDRGAGTDFTISGLRSPLFDEGRTPILKGVKLRNEVVQQVLQLLSLSKESGRKARGRISYATLGINQLGAVYEGLLSYTGFFAQEDLYEIRAAKDMKDPEARTYFVPSAKIGDYKEEEKVRDDHGRPIVHAKGAYLFRMAGRDREKSASYYTPEVLTRCLTKYTLKERLGEKGKDNYVSADEILQLTVCEPAMGSGAFLNEAVNQLADAYLERKQDELGRKIPAESYAFERQRVKYFIAVSNCYGVDLNPLAAELGKVSLWLNVLQPGVQAPYFDQRIAVGNSLIGARREVFDGADLMKSGKTESWLGLVPTRVKFGEKRPAGSVYHFLVPDLGMAPFDRDKVIKELEPENVARIKAWRKEICKPFEKGEVERLVALSDRVDVLWDEHVAMRERVLAGTRQAYPVWPGTEDGEEAGWVPGVEECEEKAKELEKAGAPGVRLKAVMDYWVALWFWPVVEAERLPGRGEWLGDVEGLLSVSDHGIAHRAASIRRVVEAERPLHWETAFSCAFSRGCGFALILGNPPWVNFTWTEADVLGDLRPAIQLRKLNASAVAAARDETLVVDSARGYFLSSFVAVAGAQAFLAATANYAVLSGVRTNLYKSFLARMWDVVSSEGCIGMLHQTGLLDDPRGGSLRAVFYQRLALVARFQNELRLFSEIGNMRPFAFSVSRGTKLPVSFRQVSLLLHPRTLDHCWAHDGLGPVPMVKNSRGEWELAGHRSRLVDVAEPDLAAFATLYDPVGTLPLEARLPSIYSGETASVLRKFAACPRRLADLAPGYYTTPHFNETNHQKDGTMRRETRSPSSASEWIVSGPHVFVGNPFSKEPNPGCKSHRDYSPVRLTEISNDFLPRTNYVPACDPREYLRRTPHWNTRPVTEFYRYVHREMVAATGERTLIAALLPPGPAHILTLLSVAFENDSDLLDFLGLSCSLPCDFFIKTSGTGHINQSFTERLPCFVPVKLRSFVHRRALRLNCLTTDYRDIWEQAYPEKGADRWTRDDTRLAPWPSERQWSREAALRTPYERRQALVELDALAALSLDLTVDELCLLYRVQFSVLHQYEHETYYDQCGRIVFTTNRGLAGVGLDRNEWEQIKDVEQAKDLPGFASEYVPPFDTCDREADMRQAYNFFLRECSDQVAVFEPTI